jgi:hypothetical protein
MMGVDGTGYMMEIFCGGKYIRVRIFRLSKAGVTKFRKC